MNFNDEEAGAGKQLLSRKDNRPCVWQVEEGDEITEDDLQSEFLGTGYKKTVREGDSMGGQNFGNNNLTPSANDKNNPSRYAGSRNPFFENTEPLEEHPENNNFKVPDQQGTPDYDKAGPDIQAGNIDPKPEKVERGNGENDRPHKGGGDQYQEGTADDDQINIPGPNELPDQQKVGEDVDDDDHRHIET